MINPPFNLYLTCPIGFETVCRKELHKLGIDVKGVSSGGLFLTGEMADVYRINYCIRAGMVLWIKLSTFDAEKEDQLYENIFALNWSEFIPPDSTMFIKCVQKGSRFKNTHYIKLKTKDAIVDSIRMIRGNRPNIDPKNPDYNLQIYLENGKGTLFLNSGGKPLNRRGYRVDNVIAPLNESLASAIIQESGWTSDIPLYDPFCGSGTICIEAAMQAMKIPPGYLRKDWAFQKTPWYNEQEWISLKQEINNGIAISKKFKIYGSDIDGFIVKNAIKNTDQLPACSGINFKQISFKDWPPSQSPGIIITNPPFGIRMKDRDGIHKLYNDIGDGLKQKCDGFKAFILCGNRKMISEIGLRSKSKKRVRISNLDGRLVEFELYSGSQKKNDP